MVDSNPIIIVGAEIAGVHAAESLRKEGYQGRIILIDRDTEAPYDRPPLSKDWMKGEMDDASLPLKDPSFFQEANIELRLGVNITSINPDEKTIESEDGQRFSYDKLLLATGANLRKLDIKGSQLDGVFYLRTLSQAKAIKQHLEHVKQAVIVGAGFIGTELASTLTQLGMDVTIVEQAAYPMKSVVGKEAAKYFLELHRSHGVDVITEDSVAEFRGDETVKEVVTQSGKRIPCQLAIIGTGVTPNTDIAHPDLQVNEGYVVTDYGETSLPDVFAAGDCTSWPYQGEHIHIEHWENAEHQGKNTAKNMVRPQSSPNTFQPYFWSDQYDRNFEYLGFTKKWSKTVTRGSMKKGEFTVFYLDEQNIVKAAFITNQPDNGEAAGKMIEEQKPVDPEKLANEQVALEEIANK